MKKVFWVFIVISLLAITSCHKTNYYGGSWMFQGSTYSAVSCSGGVGGILNASNANNNNPYSYGGIECNFYNTLPTTGGKFYVVAYPPKAADQVSFSLFIDAGDSTFASTGGNGAETVTVSVNSSNGFLTVQGNGIEMVNQSGTTDSALLSINLTQTQ